MSAPPRDPCRAPSPPAAAAPARVRYHHAFNLGTGAFLLGWSHAVGWACGGPVWLRCLLALPVAAWWTAGAYAFVRRTAAGWREC